MSHFKLDLSRHTSGSVAMVKGCGGGTNKFTKSRKVKKWILGDEKPTFILWSLRKFFSKNNLL